MNNEFARLNKTQDERESMIDYLLSLKNYNTDKAYDKAYFTLKDNSYKQLKSKYDKAITKMFSHEK